VHLGEGNYVASGTNLSLPGEWRIRVMMQRPGEYDTVVDFTPDIEPEPAPIVPEVNMTPDLGMRTLWLLLGGVGLLLFGGLAVSAGGLRKGRARLTAIPLLLVSAMFIASGVETALQQPTEQAQQLASNVTPAARQETTLPNPIPPDADSINAGNALYTQYCVPCHGTEGKGDGPVGLTLNPRPADLTVHTVVGVHTDGQLFEWISGGFPGSAMPAFGQSLSETDRWNLVNYIRTLRQAQ
jgi:mono/diheme cytochrome c family protein